MLTLSGFRPAFLKLRRFIFYCTDFQINRSPFPVPLMEERGTRRVSSNHNHYLIPCETIQECTARVSDSPSQVTGRRAL